MSESSARPPADLTDAEKTSMLFMQVVFQFSSLATMLLGKVPHPETGQTQRDLDGARVIIDQLEMLETKTRGNLSQEEEQLLRQTLMGLRMAYVEAVNEPETNPGSEEKAPRPEETRGAAAETGKDSPDPDEAGESKKRFSKKY